MNQKKDSLDNYIKLTNNYQSKLVNDTLIQNVNLTEILNLMNYPLSKNDEKG